MSAVSLKNVPLISPEASSKSTEKRLPVSKRAQTRKKDHPAPSLMDTSTVKKDAARAPWIVPAHHVSLLSAMLSDGDLAMIEDPQEAVQLFSASRTTLTGR